VLGPAARGDHDLGGVAVERRVVGDHGRQVERHRRQLAVAVVGWDDHHRADVAELARDRLAQDRLAGGSATLALGAGRPPYDAIVGLGRAGEVDVVDGVVLDQVLPDLGAAVDDAQHPGVDQRPQGALEDRPDPLVDRVHLEQAHVALDDQLRQHVHRRDGRHVAGAEDERHPTLGRALAVEAGLATDRVGAIDARRQKDAAAEPEEGQAIEGADREGVDLDPAVGAHAAAGAQGRPAAPGDRVEAVGVEPGQPHGRQRSADPLLGLVDAAQALGATTGGDPGVGAVGEARQAGPDQRGLGRRRGAREPAGVVAQRRQGVIEGAALGRHRAGGRRDGRGVGPRTRGGRDHDRIVARARSALRRRRGW
jgi:hypothetical protein